MYDRREKAQRDYQWAIESARREGLEKGVEIGLEKGREEGVQIGLEKGQERGVLIGKIQLLEQLLGEPPTPTDRLSQRSLDELNSLLAGLQGRLRSRGE
ncbi:MAG: hypothetical protein GXP27_03615 [Planctomycetes bacterium]|nr:hypothetical protein [Planctomycetota bacterium]